MLLQIVGLWTRILKKLGATKALRELLQLGTAAIHTSPLLIRGGPVRDSLNTWRTNLENYLPAYPASEEGLDRERGLSYASYTWLCSNRSCVVGCYRLSC